MKLIDTHCHIDSSEFDDDRDAVLTSAFERNVEKIIVPAICESRWQQLLSICEKHNSLYPALGLHPVYMSRHKSTDIDRLAQRLEITSVVAVGEIGLDYFIKSIDKSAQRDLLDSQCSIASQHKLPVILHCRKAYDDLINILASHQLQGGIAHAFNGSIQHAHKLIDLGFKLGFGGMLTFEHSSKLRNLAKTVPLSSIVLETDAPDLTVAQYRGERNSPEYLPLVFQALASIRSEPIEKLAFTIYQSSQSVFKL